MRKAERITQDYLRELWRNKVEERYIYRGMSAANLVFPLDPAKDPFEPLRPKLFQFLEMLDRLVNKGFKFQLVEEHFGDTAIHELSDIVNWSRNDLNDGGIDFISSHQDAKGYSDCYQGSQLKQNFKYIVEHLPAHKAELSAGTLMREKDWSLVSEVKEVICQEAKDHKRIVLWAQRSCPVFDSSDDCLWVGSFESFSSKLVKRLEEMSLPCEPKSVDRLLPDEERSFSVRARQIINKDDVEKVEEIL